MRVRELFVSRHGVRGRLRSGRLIANAAAWNMRAVGGCRRRGGIVHNPCRLVSAVLGWVATLALAPLVFAEIRAQDSASADITSLTREEAAAVVEQAGGALVLGQLSGIGPEAALELARHGGGLALDGLTTLDAAVARALALHGRVPATAPADLDVDALLAKIADLSGGEDGPDLDGIEALLAGLGVAAGDDVDAGTNPPNESSADASDPAAADEDPWLSLGGLEAIDAALAAALAMHEGPLLLDGVRELSIEAAEALAAHVGELSLAGLTSLPDDVRDALAEHDGPVAIPDSLVGK